MGEQNGHVSNLFEDGWFFGNTLLNTSNTSKIMVRCNSDPCSSSSSKKETLVSQHHSKMSNNLHRTPSLPVSLGRDSKYQLDEEEEEEEEDEPRMGDLIRQAMPMPMPIMPRRRLDRTPSLPPCRGDEALNMASNVQSGAGVGRLTRRESIDSSALLPEKGPIAMSKLTRRASIDSSLLLPPKCTTSKSTKQNTSNSKTRAHRKLEQITETKPQKLDKSKSQKSLTDLEVEELQGFKDLGFSFDNKDDLSPGVTQILPALQRRASLDSNNVDNIGKVRRPYLSESWQQKTSSPISAPPALKWDDQKASSSEDMKAQIKFWARAVASNVRQEC